MKALRFTTLILLGTAATWMLWRWCWIPLEVNRQKKSAEAAITAALNTGRSSEMAFLVQRGLPNLEKWIVLMPNDVDLLAEKAGMLRLVKRREDAVDTYRKVIEIEKRPEFYLNLARVLVDLNREQEAVDVLLVVARFDKGSIGAEWSPSVLDALNSRLGSSTRSRDGREPRRRERRERGSPRGG